MRALVFSIDDNYVMPFKVLWHSLMDTESVSAYTPIYILHEDSLSRKSIEDLTAFCGKYERSFIFLEAQDFVPDDVPLNAHFTRATYYRLYLASILPNSVTSVVYLDSDAVAVRSVRELFDFDLTSPLAAVDHFNPRMALRLWGDTSAGYFQSGVLILDLTAWRTAGYEQVFTSIIHGEWDRIRWVDQDVLNIAFKEQWQQIPAWFNVHNGVRKEVGQQAINSNGRFIHLCGSAKPWKYNARKYDPKTPHAMQWYKAYEQCFGQPFAGGRLSRQRQPFGHRQALNRNTVNLSILRPMRKKMKIVTNFFGKLTKNLHSNENHMKTRTDFFKKIDKNLTIAELGVFLGDFSIDILRLSSPSKLYLIDKFEKSMSADKDGKNRTGVIDLNSRLDEIKQRFQSYDNVELKKMLTKDFLESIPDNHLDVVYIDADHSYAGVTSDLELSRIKVKPGGVIMGHDYGCGFKGCIKAVDEFCLKYGLSIEHLTDDGCPSYWITNKK